MKANVFKHTAQERKCTVYVAVAESYSLALCCIILNVILLNPKGRGATRNVEVC